MKLFILCFLFTINAFAKVGDFTLDSENTLYIVDGDSISMQMRLYRYRYFGNTAWIQKDTFPDYLLLSVI